MVHLDGASVTHLVPSPHSISSPYFPTGYVQNVLLVILCKTIEMKSILKVENLLSYLK